ncbi:MAG: TolC family protein [Candidatus Obscuribacterales bacterium]|nr:TolC family protein [Candidatus Obscuribacterales bacterium]
MPSHLECIEKRTLTALAMSLALTIAPWCAATAQLLSPTEKQKEEEDERNRLEGSRRVDKQNINNLQNALKGSNVSSMQKALDAQNTININNAKLARPLPMKPITDTDNPTGLESAPVLKGVTPATPVPNPSRLAKTGLSSENDLALDELKSVADESNANNGVIFVQPDQINVKAPLLKAMVALDQKMSPYSLDALSTTPVTLHDVLESTLLRNLPIKISNQDTFTKLWQLRESYAGFLPNLSQEVSYEGLNGTYVTPVGAAVPIKNPYLSMTSQFSWYVFKGGAIVHGMLGARDKYRASKYALNTTINDALLDTTKSYYNLVLSDVLLQIRIKAVEVARGVVIVNQDQYDFGTIPQVDVLQAKYQLSQDRQELIKQQVTRRQSAISLATDLNLDQSVDLTLQNRTVRKIRLVDDRMTPGDLLRVAIDNRPELKRYEQLRLAAREAVKVAKAALFPTVAVTGSGIDTGSKVFRNTNSTSSGNQTAIGSGSGIGSIFAAEDLPIGTSSQGPKRWTSRSLFLIGVDLNWQLGGLGLQQVAGIQVAKSQAREVQLEFAKEMNKIYGEVRDTYLSSITAENLIVETTDAVRFSQEALRIAEIRFKEGVGTYVDVLIAQRNYIAALTAKAHAIIDYNLAQATLLHAIGRNNVNTLTSSVPLRE